MRPWAQAAALVVAATAWGFAQRAASDDPLPLRGRLGPPPVAEPGADLPAVDAAVAVAQWEEGTIFLDARSPAEFEQSRVSGSLSFPADDLENAYFERVAGLGPDMPVLVYGAGPDSFRVRRAAQYLLDAGQVSVSLAVCGVDELLRSGVDRGSGPAEELW